MINKDLLYIQIFFMFSIIINLFISGLLFLKILLILLLFLFILKSKDSFVYNRAKYDYFSYGLLLFSILFLLSNYITSPHFFTALFCILILFIYLFKVLFNTSYGEVIKNHENGMVEIKVLDPFFKTKNVVLKNKKLLTGSIVVFSLTKFPLAKKPVQIIDVVPPQLSTDNKTKNIKKPPKIKKPIKKNIKKKRK